MSKTITRFPIIPQSLKSAPHQNQRIYRRKIRKIKTSHLDLKIINKNHKEAKITEMI
jgi:hypothetical protein